MFKMTSGDSAGSNSVTGKKERLLVTSEGPGREGCKIARPKIRGKLLRQNNDTLMAQKFPFLNPLMPLPCRFGYLASSRIQ